MSQKMGPYAGKPSLMLMHPASLLYGPITARAGKLLAVRPKPLIISPLVL